MALMLARESFKYGELHDRARAVLLSKNQTPDPVNKVKQLMLTASIQGNTLDVYKRQGYEYDEAVLKCFLKQQDRLFPEPVAEGMEEAEAFLEDCMAVVVDSKAAVMEYFEEAGIDVENPDQVLDEAEVFDVGDGRYLIVEG